MIDNLTVIDYFYDLLIHDNLILINIL